MMRQAVGSTPHDEPFELFFVLYNWCNEGHSMYFSVCGMVHMKDPLLLIGKSSPCSGGNGLPLSQSEWSFTIYQTSDKRK